MVVPFSADTTLNISNGDKVYRQVTTKAELAAYTYWRDAVHNLTYVRSSSRIGGNMMDGRSQR